LGRNGSQDVFIAAFDPQLRRVKGFPRRVTGREARVVDQFWPTSAVDPVRVRLWLCFYVSGAGRSRVTARFSCTSSADGRRWDSVVPVASVASNETVPRADGDEYGDYEGLAVRDGVAHALWSDSRDLTRYGEEIYAATLRRSP
jgi:hypothetical protein